MSAQIGCALCEQEGGVAVFRNAALRVIRATGDEQSTDHPAFYRVIWNAHVAEWSELPEPDRNRLMQAVTCTEQVLREQLAPTKVNLASLGNVVPHLHWHVIARFDWDARWPAPVWAPKQKEVADATSRLPLTLAQLDARVASSLARLG